MWKSITLFDLLMKTFSKSTNAVYCRGRSPPPRRRRTTWRCSAAASRGEPQTVMCYAWYIICVILWLADGIINPTLSPLLLQVPPLQRAGGQHHLRRHHRRLHQEVPGQDVRWVAETRLLVVMLLELEMKVKQRFSKPPVTHEHCVSTPISHLLTYHGVNVHLA